MSEITEKQYESWFTTTFGEPYDVWHDGLATENVTRLTGDARSHAVRMLIFGVQIKHEYAATALAAMGETSALPYLRAALPTAKDYSKVKIALAIEKLSLEDDSCALAKELISVLEDQSLHYGVKIDAAIGLRNFKDEKSEEALLRAVEQDDEYLVQYHCCESLLVRWGVWNPRISSHPAIFELIGNVGEDDVIQDKAERGKEAVRLLLELKTLVAGSRF